MNWPTGGDKNIAPISTGISVVLSTNAWSRCGKNRVERSIQTCDVLRFRATRPEMTFFDARAVAVGAGDIRLGYVKLGFFHRTIALIAPSR